MPTYPSGTTYPSTPSTLAGRTYGQLQDEVLSHQLNDAKYRPYVKVWLNEGQRYIIQQADVRLEEAETGIETSSGLGSYALPGDYARLIDLRNSTDQDLLTPMDLREFDDLTTSSGKPSYFVVIAQSINFYPTPDAEYELILRYWRQPADMDSVGDTPDLPAQYHHLLVRYALVRAFERENDYEAANYWRNQFEADLQKMRGEVHHDTFYGPRQVPGMWDEGFYDYNAWR